ncbi:MAG: cysteine hydrolase [Verrucomicrobiaceae bacterium]|nr:cysteine hydrolase [Verrucomicrobiaceae bacterium]
MKSRASKAALLMIDVLNDFLFPESEKLLHHALPAAKRLAILRRRLKGRGLPVIYVNDNFGHWRSDFKEQIARCTSSDCPGHEVAMLLLPEADDYFVLKPKHSGFYATPLEVLLGHLGVRELVLTGFAGDICVLCTAYDAHMRDYGLTIVSDCVASETERANRVALEQMKANLNARVVRSSSLIRSGTRP